LLPIPAVNDLLKNVEVEKHTEPAVASALADAESEQRHAAVILSDQTLSSEKIVAALKEYKEVVGKLWTILCTARQQLKSWPSSDPRSGCSATYLE
jgi:hypothetical protein